MIRLVVLGVSGSIGKQVLQIVRENPNEFEIVGVSVNTSIEGLNDLVNEFPSIKLVGIANKEKFLEAKDKSLFEVTSTYYPISNCPLCGKKIEYRKEQEKSLKLVWQIHIKRVYLKHKRRPRGVI